MAIQGQAPHNSTLKALGTTADRNVHWTVLDDLATMFKSGLDCID